MLNSIKLMLKSFEKNNIIYCHWKSNEHIEQALDGDTDLDILFLPEQRSIIEKILNFCGLKRFRATPLMQYNAIEDFIGFDYDTAKIWHLHTHYRMTLGEKHLKGYTINLWGNELLKNRILANFGIYTSCPEDELIILVSRIALKLRWRDRGKKLSDDDIKEINWLLPRINKVKLNTNLNQYLSDNLKKEFINLINQQLTYKNQFINFQKILKKELKPFTGNSFFTSLLKKSIRELFWFYGAVIRHTGNNSNSPSRRVSPSGGTVITFLGCDGSGKTTTIKYLKKEFSKKLDVKTIYFGSGDGECAWYRYPMKLVAKILGGKGLGHKVEKEYSEKRNISLKSRLYSFAKILWAIALAFEKKSKLNDMTKARNAGMLVLTDRYPQIKTSGLSDGPLLTKYLNSKFNLLKIIAEKEYEIYKLANINPPDLVIKLMVPTDIAIARKPEMTKEEIENKKKAVSDINITDKTIVIDTSVDLKNSISKIMAEIWKII